MTMRDYRGVAPGWGPTEQTDWPDGEPLPPGLWEGDPVAGRGRGLPTRAPSCPLGGGRPLRGVCGGWVRCSLCSWPGSQSRVTRVTQQPAGLRSAADKEQAAAGGTDSPDWKVVSGDSRLQGHQGDPWLAVTPLRRPTLSSALLAGPGAGTCTKEKKDFTPNKCCALCRTGS